MSRKIINIITPHFAPEITAASNRMETAARVLSASFQVNVFTLTERGKRPQSEKVQWNDNLAVHYSYLPEYPKSVFLLRAFFEWWHARRLVKKSNSVNADLAIITAPFMFLISLSATHCKAKKKVADIRDIVWHYLPEKNFLQRLVKRILSKYFHRALNKFHVITVTNEQEKKWMKKNTAVNPDIVHIVSNGITEDKFRFLQSVGYSFPQNDFVITYVGNIGSSQELLPVIDAVKNHQGIRLNLIGDGNEVKRIRKYILRNKIDNVSVPGKQKWSRIVPYYQSSSLLFAGLKPEYDTAIPSKLYEYLSTGLPVLFQGSGAAASFLKNFENTFVVRATDSFSMKKEIMKIMHQSPGRSDDNARKVFDYYLRRKLSTRFVELSAGLLLEKTLSNVYVEDLLG